MKIFKKLTAMVMAVGVLISSSAFADTVKIAFIDPLSGPFATTGSNGLAEWKFAVEKLVNEKGGVLGGKMEVVALDNKMDGRVFDSSSSGNRSGNSLIAQGIHLVLQTLLQIWLRHNKRNLIKE